MDNEKPEGKQLHEINWPTVKRDELPDVYVETGFGLMLDSQVHTPLPITEHWIKYDDFMDMYREFDELKKSSFLMAMAKKNKMLSEAHIGAWWWRIAMSLVKSDLSESIKYATAFKNRSDTLVGALGTKEFEIKQLQTKLDEIKRIASVAPKDKAILKVLGE